MITIQDTLLRCVDEAYREHTERTAYAYQWALKAFANCLTDRETPPTMTVDNVSVEHFIAFPSWLLKQGYAKKTIGTYVRGVKYYLEWLIVNGYIMPSYAENLRLQKAIKGAFNKPEDKLPRTPKQGDREKMIEAAHVINEPSPRKERDLALVLFLATSGCRNAETLNLKVKDFDLQNQSAKVLGKGNHERVVYYSQETAEALRQYWQARGHMEQNSPAFCRHDRATGKEVQRLSTNGAREIISNVAMVAGIDHFIPHQFRHAFAVKILEETHDLVIVQDALGHKDPKTTRVYAKLAEGVLRKTLLEIFK